MAIVPVVVTDSVPTPTKWEMPRNYEGLRSPIPRGLITFRGKDAIATLAAGSETSYRVTVTTPIGFIYLPKVLNMAFVSDDLVAQFNLIGLGNYGGPLANPLFNMVSPGLNVSLAATGIQVWYPAPATPKLFVVGGNTLGLRVSDMSTGGSSAGDMEYYIQMYVFDIDQIDKWEVNTPIPTISHSVF